MVVHNTRPLAPLRVMLLDDNSAMRRILRSVLTGFGCENINVHAKISTALEELTVLRPDLIVADYELNGPSGLDFVAAVRSHDDESLRATPVILLTSHTSISQIRTFVNAGVDEVLAKPVRPDQLYERIAAVVNRPRTYVEVEDFFGPDRRRMTAPIDEDDRRTGEPGRSNAGRSTANR